MWGWILIGLGALVSLISLYVRCKFKRPEADENRKFRNCLLGSLASVILAAVGLIMLLQGDTVCGKDNSTILNVLALLSAGVISGFFGFSYEKANTQGSGASKLKALLPDLLSICFTMLFFLLFGSICYYMGQSQEVHETNGIYLLVPSIMVMILLGNVLFDYWDYTRKS